MPKLTVFILSVPFASKAPFINTYTTPVHNYITEICLSQGTENHPLKVSPQKVYVPIGFLKYKQL
jgi:hypothetical protein